ncbi:IS30 family transposase [Xanthomonas oryzae pv. oryzae]|nr:IS30 family transposase [Xanthomonas oryzae]AXM13102.1 IS30 family transposase [Xanthomonas oryzae pv. oryzae]
MSSSRLDLSERYRLHALYETGMSMRAIADVLARAPSTISRELRRNRHADHRLIAACLQSDFYFADPYCPWQRGSNENANGLTRQYLPRQTDFSTITDAHLRWIEQRLYNRPRKILGFKTPLEVFSEEVLNSVANQS